MSGVNHPAFFFWVSSTLRSMILVTVEMNFSCMHWDSYNYKVSGFPSNEFVTGSSPSTCWGTCMLHNWSYIWVLVQIQLVEPNTELVPGCTTLLPLALARRLQLTEAPEARIDHPVFFQSFLNPNTASSASLSPGSSVAMRALGDWKWITVTGPKVIGHWTHDVLHCMPNRFISLYIYIHFHRWQGYKFIYIYIYIQYI